MAAEDRSPATDVAWDGHAVVWQTNFYFLVFIILDLRFI